MTAKYSMAGLIAWLALCFSIAWFAAQFEPGACYESLAKPEWTPPNQAFGPVWAILYTLMGIAAWLVWKKDGFRNAGRALGLFLIQLVLNALWSWLFFGLHWPAVAFVEILMLWLTVLVTLVLFWRHRPLAGMLLTPYLAWLSVALALNFSIWQMNG